MGNGPRNRWAWHAGRWMVALAVTVALLIAPIVVILTHGPAAHAFGADTASQIATHGHAHGDVGDGPFGGHDATDHEHHLQALLVQPGEAWRPMASGARHGAIASFRGLPRDRPKRPPRPV
ncbi:MAG: hypothetical protein MI824_01355 [Hyphomicrobiales bacterium]|nr:hypothetical protein [Hyphomicrobiales bacterium]